MDNKKKGLIILGIVLLIYISIPLYNNVLFPAYLSYTSACDPQLFEDKYSDTYYVAGNTTLEPTGNITIVLSSYDETLYKHELIHANQIQRKWPSLNCVHPIQKYLSEVEAYTFQYFPDWIYYRIYS